VVSSGNQHVGINLTGQGLLSAAKLDVDPTTPLLVEKHTPTVLPVIQPPAVAKKPVADDERQPRKIRAFRPSLVGDPLPLRIGDVDRVLPAALSALVAVPILNDGQVANREWHGSVYPPVGVHRTRYHRFYRDQSRPSVRGVSTCV
jgi:hypothetical protein